MGFEALGEEDEALRARCSRLIKAIHTICGQTQSLSNLIYQIKTAVEEMELKPDHYPAQWLAEAKADLATLQAVVEDVYGEEGNLDE
jgi:sensor domain CHASE-containing protein